VVRAAATTAVVAGTAGAVHHHQAQKYAQQDAANQYAAAQQAGAMQPQVPMDELSAKLQNLADLHASGVLSDEEFAAAKKKLLAS